MSEIWTQDRQRKNPRLSDTIYDALLEQISSGELAPGTRLVESEIAKRHGVSQAPVREALRNLASSGMVLQLQRRGSFVATISEPSARRAYDVRAVLEEFAAVDFIEHASAESMAILDTLLDDLRSSARADDLQAFVEADIAFHRFVWRAGGNDMVARIWPLIETAMRSLTLVSNRVYFGSLAEIAETHQPLVASLQSRDKQAAAAAFRQHVSAIWTRVGAEANATTEGE